jgi:transposase
MDVAISFHTSTIGRPSSCKLTLTTSKRMKVTLILGIDIAKLKFDVCLRRHDASHENASFDNNQKGFQQLQKWLLKREALLVHACMEATSRYGDALALFLFEHKHLVSVINARRARKYADSRLVRTQNDRIDAELIADFCAKESPRLWQPSAGCKRQLQDLLRLRDFFTNQLGQTKNRRECTSRPILAQLQRHIKKLERSVAEVDKQILALTKTAPELATQIKLLRTIPGVGPITAAVCVAELPPVPQIDSVSAAVAYAGVDPRKKTSGTSVSTTPRLSKMGPRLLRKCLYMAALSACRSNPIIHNQSQRLAAKGKTGKLALGAAMRKLMRLIYGVLKHQMPFDPAWTPSRAVHLRRRMSDGDGVTSLQLASTSVANA